ncbi:MULTISPECIES: DUF2591 domain-containing protein [Pseudomonas putida group]|uniref:DUF2591 domain-containing protein n=1 Tax=Pseudomonas putida group TaxID=136845 RepID=UPI0002E72F59|nr:MULTISPECIES: DUF2591 domain-containing protein [Pseudomonas putida group]ODB40310.1 DUF2591 domain-containing protein [Pseudomonas mosselii]
MTDLIEVKTADLAGEALGWAVGTAEGLELILAPPEYGNPWRVFARYRASATEHDKRYNPWEDWALGGSIIDRFRVDLSSPPVIDTNNEIGWQARPDDGRTFWHSGGTALIAVCRAVVAAKLGDTVQVPKELLQ